MEDIVRRALLEDGVFRDVTSPLVGGRRAKGRIVAREDLVVCGMDVARQVFRRVGVAFRPKTRDGRSVRRGAVLAVVEGRARRMLAGERVALSFLQMLSGVATLTRRFVERAGKAKIYDTRKTTPGLRKLEKYAVRCGGGVNHRLGLHDGILIKDNHIAVIGDMAELRRKVRALAARGRKVEIEAQDIEQARLFATFPIRILMLDNYTVAGLRRAVRCVRAIRPRLLLEASGGVTLRNVGAVARTGVDWISVGGLTHSAPACDIALEL